MAKYFISGNFLSCFTLAEECASDYKMLRSEITGKCFNTIEEHTKFIINGCCAELIDELVKL